MTKKEELQAYVDSFGDPQEAEFDLQLLLSMRNGEFKPGRLVFEILSIYKDLVNSKDILADWDYPQEDLDAAELINYIDTFTS